MPLFAVHRAVGRHVKEPILLAARVILVTAVRADSGINSGIEGDNPSRITVSEGGRQGGQLLVVITDRAVATVDPPTGHLVSVPSTVLRGDVGPNVERTQS